jgi:nitrogen fixation protein NifU and related proteins
LSENELLNDHFFNPRNICTSQDYPNYVYAQVGDKKLGDSIGVYLHCELSGKILDLKYRVYGNPYLIAAMSLCSEQVMGMKVEQIVDLDYQHWVLALDIPKTKRFSVLLVEDALKLVIKKWQEYESK